MPNCCRHQLSSVSNRLFNFFPSYFSKVNDLGIVQSAKEFLFSKQGLSYNAKFHQECYAKLLQKLDKTTFTSLMLLVTNM